MSYLRYAENEVACLTPSIESADRVVASGWFDVEKNLSRYYNARLYPDCEFQNVEYDSLDELFDAIREQAEKDLRLACEIVCAVEPYHIVEHPEIGLCIQADHDAVNAEPEGSTAPTGLPLFEIEGEYIGENLMKDGSLIAHPRIVRRIA